jgi:hypothetical protein
MTKWLLAGLAAITLGLSSSGASADPPLMAQAPPPPAPAEAAGLDLAHRYLAIIKFKDLMQRMMDQMMPTITAPMLATGRGLSAEQKTALVGALHDTITDFIPRFADKAAQMIAASYTHEELQALVDFYESPIGESIAAKGLNMQQVTAQAIQSLAPQMMRDMFRHLCAKTECPPQIKAMAPNES